MLCLCALCCNKKEVRTCWRKKILWKKGKFKLDMKEEKEIYKGSSHGPTRHGYRKPCSVFWSSLSAAVFLGELDFTVGIQLWHLIWNLHSELQALGLNVITYDCVHLTLQSTLLFDTFILYFPERAPNILALEKYLLSKITNPLDAPLSAQMRRVTMNTSSQIITTPHVVHFQDTTTLTFFLIPSFRTRSLWSSLSILSATTQSILHHFTALCPVSRPF